MTPSSVVVEDLVKRFGDFVAVDHISLETRKGEIFGFLGPNGAGKSTTIRMLCGLLTPTSGHAVVAGYDIRRQPEAVRQNIGYMSQKFSLYNDLKVIENLRLFAGLYSVPDNVVQERIDWALQTANLKGQESLITGTLPGGWKQRLALGCAVLHQSAHHLSRRTHLRRRPHFAPPVLGPDSSDGSGRRDRLRHHSLHGRSGVLQSAGPDFSRQDGRARHSRRAQEKSMKGELLLVECADPGKAVDALQSAPGVLDAAVFGNALHLVVPQADAAIPQVQNFLAERGITVGKIEKIRPSLEDVFVSLTTDRDSKRPN